MIFYIPKFRQGGLEKVFTKYLLAISEIHPVSLICDRDSRTFIEKTLLKDSNLKILYISNNRFFRIISFIFLIIFLYRNKSIHLVQLDAFKAGAILGIFLKLNLTYHERTYVNKKNRIIISKLINYQKSSLKKIYVNSDDQKFLFEKEFSNCIIERLHNPIINNPRAFEENISKKSIDPNTEIKIICSGRLDGQKNLGFIYKHAETIVKKYKNAKIYMYLDDSSFSKVHSNEYIKIKKFITYDFFQELSDKHIAIVNTNFEGFSSQLFEYGIANLKIVSTDHKHGFKEMRKEFDINTFEIGNIDSLLDSLEKVKLDDFNKINNFNIDWAKNFLVQNSVDEFLQKLSLKK